MYVTEIVNVDRFNTLSLESPGMYCNYTLLVRYFTLLKQTTRPTTTVSVRPLSRLVVSLERRWTTVVPTSPSCFVCNEPKKQKDVAAWGVLAFARLLCCCCCVWHTGCGSMSRSCCTRDLSHEGSRSSVDGRKWFTQAHCLRPSSLCHVGKTEPFLTGRLLLCAPPLSSLPSVQKSDHGQVLLDVVFKHLELTERDYFGLHLADDSLDTPVSVKSSPWKGGVACESGTACVFINYGVCVATRQ